MVKRGAILALLLATAVLSAAPPEVPKEMKVKPGQLVRITVKTDAELGSLKNFSDEEAFWGELVSPKGQRSFVFQAPAVEVDKTGKVIPPKRSQYVIGWWVKGETEGSSTTLTLDGIAPPPPPVPNPVDPPVPDPKPVSEAPIKQDGLSVLILEESADRSKLSTGQNAVLFGAEVRNYLRTKCVKNVDSPVGAWNIWDKDSDVSGTPKVWQDAFARGKSKATSYPWVLISNGKSGFEGALAPTTSASDFINTVKMYEVVQP